MHFQSFSQNKSIKEKQLCIGDPKLLTNTNSRKWVLLCTIQLSHRIHNWTQQKASIRVLALLHRAEMEGAVRLGGDPGRERTAVGGAAGKGKERASAARVMAMCAWCG